MTPRPMLDGVRILAVEQYGAGPFGTLFLADLGAEVIKIENRAEGGDVSRAVGPHFHAGLPETAQSVFYQGFNRSKKSVTLDLSRPEGKAVFQRLAARADAVASNLRGDVPAKLGLTYSQLAAANPRIVCAHLTGYGREGERAAWPGYDYLMQAEAGYFHLTGEPDSAPARFGLSLVDLMSGIALAAGLLAALRAADRDGRGRDVDVSLFDLALANLNYIGHWYLNAGAATGRIARSAHASITPCQSYRTRDGWIYLMCNKEKFWAMLCRKLGRAEWIDDARFRRFPDRLEHRDLLTVLIDEALQARTTAEWLAAFAGSVPAAPIHDVTQALENPWVKGSARIESIPVAGGPPLALLTNPLRGEGLPLRGRPAPALGADTDAVLADAGFARDEIARLRARGIV
ncbi:MAG TPA: CoA transferase [Burkholderiales bacterium]|nr:CoA transferase [Burkholderiales bacterium]